MQFNALSVTAVPGSTAPATPAADAGETPIVHTGGVNTYMVTDGICDADTVPPSPVVVSVSVLHHMPLNDVVPLLVNAVAPGGVLLIQDVVTREGLRYLPINGIAFFYKRFRAHFSGRRQSRQIQRLYNAHGEGEEYLTPSEVEPAFGILLPEARVLHHLDWRYSVVWQRPRSD